ncbi:hypothetical protein BG004_007545 [Podila humilis]|nr:hypothetical protein BG004_007545 [Podila humilis]
MSKSLVGLVAYGDSDSETDISDNDDAVAIPPKVTEPVSSTTTTSAPEIQAQDPDAVDSQDQGTERPSPQDTISIQSAAVGRSVSGNDTANKSSATLLKYTLEAEHSKEHHRSVSSESIQTGDSSLHSAVNDSLTFRGTNFARSQSGTPLPPDHSAAAEVYNTPTNGMSPIATQTNIMHMGELAGSKGSSSDLSLGDRGALMRLLLKPRPIPNIENFGIPPNPEGEVNPAVQAKMEQFHHIKMTRGIHFNQSLMKNKNFRNPHIYSSLVDLVALNEIGSNFEKKEFFDFEGYGPECYAAGLAEAQKQAGERMAMQQQAIARSQVQFISGSNQGASGMEGGMPTLSSIGPASASASSSAAAAAAAAIAARHQQHHQAQVPSAGHVAATQLQAQSHRGSRKSKWDSAQSEDMAHKKSRH